MKIRSKIYKNLMLWVKRNLEVLWGLGKIKREDVMKIKVEGFIEKEGYILGVMVIRVGVAGEVKFYGVNEELGVRFGGGVFLLFL